MSDFQSTLWSVVLRAKDPEALNRLCDLYWKPVYAYVRRKGHSPEDAEDRTQGFFAHLIEKDLVARVDPGRGRFRSWLVAVLDHYLANEYRRDHARKRTRDFPAAETEVACAPEKPEAAFLASWRMIVLEQAFDALRREFESRGLAGHFEAVRSHLSAAEERPSYEALAARLGVSLVDVTNLLHRSRKRLRELIRDVLRETVESEAELESEVRDLFS